MPNERLSRTPPLVDRSDSLVDNPIYAFASLPYPLSSPSFLIARNIARLDPRSEPRDCVLRDYVARWFHCLSGPAWASVADWLDVEHCPNHALIVRRVVCTIEDMFEE